jgi:hypothetical protein
MLRFIAITGACHKTPATLCAIAIILIASPATTFAWNYLHFDVPSGSKEALWREPCRNIVVEPGPQPCRYRCR